MTGKHGDTLTLLNVNPPITNQMLTEANKEAVDKTVSFYYSDNWDIYPEFEAIKDLVDWSDNFQGPVTPFGLYLDLIGYSAQYYGETQCDICTCTFSHILGYKELCLLGDALNVFKKNGYQPVFRYIEELIEND